MMAAGRARWMVSACLWLTLFVCCVYLFLPTGRINGAIDRILSDGGFRLTPAAHKTLLPGLAWKSPQLSSGQGPLIGFARLEIRPLLSRLLAGRVAVGAEAVQEAGGRLSLEYSRGGSNRVLLGAEQLQLKDIPFFKTVLGGAVSGTLRGEGFAETGKQGWNGEFRVEMSALEYSGVKMGGIALPDAAGLQSKGMVRIADGRARLESFTLQGEGVYMRLSGDLPAGGNPAAAPLNLTLEIMPKPDFLERQKLVFLLLAKFMASPGVYRIPITGTILNPHII